jgi:hypothetical protein
LTTTRGRLLTLVLASLLALSLTASAQASIQQQSMFQDDNLLVYASPARQARTLDTLRSLGVDQIRVSVFWSIVAPSPRSRTAPRFDAADPAAYPAGSFDRYDTLVELAQTRGIAVNFDVTSPAPYWATGHPPRGDIEKNWNPSASAFGQFVTALGTRYSGTYVPTSRAPHVPAGQPLPRVSSWSFWNEPNQPGWLTPQYTGVPGNAVMAAPRIYRALVDAGFAALLATGHAPAADGGSDTVLIGETAPQGNSLSSRIAGCSSKQTAELCTLAIKPVPFIQSLYCVNSHERPLTGTAATQVGCPVQFAPATFRQDNPALFLASGWSHHPYELTFAPTFQLHDPDSVVIGNLPTLTSLLGRVLAAYGVRRPLGLPLYLTEFGYLTNPPSPLGVTLAQQAAYLNESEFIAYNNPNVQVLSQFLLVDSAPKAGVSNPLLAYGGTFQTGLEFAGGTHKPAYDAYRLPLYVPDPHVSHRGGSVRVWGEVRALRLFSSATVQVQLRASGSSRWRTLRTITLTGAQRFIDTHVSIPASGVLRLSWQPAPAARAVLSRTVGVRA